MWFSLVFKHCELQEETSIVTQRAQALETELRACEKKVTVSLAREAELVSRLTIMEQRSGEAAENRQQVAAFEQEQFLAMLQQISDKLKHTSPAASDTGRCCQTTST